MNMKSMGYRTRAYMHGRTAGPVVYTRSVCVRSKTFVVNLRLPVSRCNDDATCTYYGYIEYSAEQNATTKVKNIAF
jgi:hypothetical protein